MKPLGKYFKEGLYGTPLTDIRRSLLENILKKDYMERRSQIFGEASWKIFRRNKWNAVHRS